MMTKDAAWELIKNNEHPMDEVISIIQLDAFKAGAGWAASIAKANGEAASAVPILNETCCVVSQAILSAASNLKELPK